MRALVLLGALLALTNASIDLRARTQPPVLDHVQSIDDAFVVVEFTTTSTPTRMPEFELTEGEWNTLVEVTFETESEPSRGGR